MGITSDTQLELVRSLKGFPTHPKVLYLLISSCLFISHRCRPDLTKSERLGVAIVIMTSQLMLKLVGLDFYFRDTPQCSRSHRSYNQFDFTTLPSQKVLSHFGVLA